METRATGSRRIGTIVGQAGPIASGSTLMVLALLSACSRGSQQPTGSDPAQLAALQAQVAYLTDRQQITDTLQRYIRGIDRHDKDLARSAFWPEARINLGTPSGRDEYVDHEEAALAAYAAHQHHITGQTVEINGNTAHVESYVFFIAVPRDRSRDTEGPATPGRAKVSEKTQLGSGRYIERWEKRDGEWKILVREYVHEMNVYGQTVDYCSTRPCLSRWDHDDLSYVRPLEPLTQEERLARAEANQVPHSPEGH